MDKYANLGHADTLALIAARAKRLSENPYEITEHIDSLIELANHFKNKYEHWRNEHFKEQLQYVRQQRQFERECQRYQPDSDNTELAN
jgi:hypothetical protein